MCKEQESPAKLVRLGAYAVETVLQKKLFQRFSEDQL